MNENIVVKVGADISSLSRDLNKATSDLKGFGSTSSSSLSQAAKDAGIYTDASGRMRNANGQFVTSAEKAALGIDNIGNSSTNAFSKIAGLSKALAGLAVVGVAAVTAGLGKSVSMFADFDSEMRKAGAIAGATTEEFEAMKAAAIELGGNTSKSASEVATAMTELAAKGFDANQVMAAMPGIISAAEASGEDLAMTSDTIASALNIWGLEASESSRVADVLAMSANKSAAGISDLAYVMKYAGAPAATLGIGLEEVAAAAGIMVSAGLDGSNAGTSLRASLLALNAPAEAQSKIMQNLGISTRDSNNESKSLSEIIQNVTQSLDGMTEAQKVATLSKLVGTEAVSGFLALMKAGPTEIDTMSESLRNSAGASAEAAEKMKAGIGGALEQLSGAAESFALSIGDKLAPYVQKLATWLANVDTQPLIDGFSGIVDGIAAFGTKFGEIKSFIGEGGLLKALGIDPSIVTMAKSLLGTLSENFSTVLSGIKVVVKDVFSFMKAYILPVVGEVVSFAITKMAEMKKFWDANGKQILQAVKNVWNGIKAVIDFVMPAVLFVIKMVWENIKGVIDGALKVIKGLIKVFAGLFTGDFSKMWEGIKDIFSGAIQVVWNLFNLLLYGRLLKAGAALFSGLKSVFTGGWSFIKSNTTTFLNWIKSFAESSFSSMKTSIANAMAKIITAIKTKWDEAVSFLKGIDLKQIGKNIIDGLVNGIKSVLGNVKGIITDLASNIPAWAKKILDINSPSKVMYGIGEWTGIGMANGIASTKAHNEAVMKDLGAVIAGVAKSNASEIAVINKAASAEQNAIAKKATADIAAIYANARDNKRKLTATEVRRIAKIEDDADAKIVANKRKHKAEIVKIDQESASERMSAIQKFLENKNKLEQLSLIDEVNIWRKAAASFKDGTQEKIDAQANYRNALAKVNAEITSINETYAGKMSAINDKLRADEEALTKTYTDTLNSRMSSLMSFAGIFDAFDATVEQSGSELLSNLNSQVDGFKLWQSEIEKISGKAIDAGLLEELRQMGPKALPELLALNSLTAEQLAEYSSLYQEKAALARMQAEAELVGMKADTAKRITELRATANTELALLQTEWVAKIKGVTQATSNEFKTLTQIGKNAGQNLLDGLKSMEGALVAQATAIAQAVNAALQGAFGGSVEVAGYDTPNTSLGTKTTANKTSSASSAKSGVTQNITINSNTPLSPAEIARKQKQAAQQLAMEWR